jgi:hypothetical protein
MLTMDLHLFLPSFQKAIAITAVGLLSYSLVCVVYNLYFHPLSRFPGPRGAACTKWWLAYWELGRGVSLSVLREELHKQYGTLSFPFGALCDCLDQAIVDVDDQVTLCGSPRTRWVTCVLFGKKSSRDSPSNFTLFLQLHFAKPTAYNEIYTSQNKWDKDYNLYRAFDLDESFFSQTDYLKSKHSRALVSNLFSKSAVAGLQHLIRGQVRSIYPGFECAWPPSRWQSSQCSLFG